MAKIRINLSLDLAMTVSVTTPMIHCPWFSALMRTLPLQQSRIQEFSITRTEMRGELLLEDPVSWVTAETGC